MGWDGFLGLSFIFVGLWGAMSASFALRDFIFLKCIFPIAPAALVKI